MSVSCREPSSTWRARSCCSTTPCRGSCRSGSRGWRRTARAWTSAPSGGMTSCMPGAAQGPGTPCHPARGRRHLSSLALTSCTCCRRSTFWRTGPLSKRLGPLCLLRRENRMDRDPTVHHQGVPRSSWQQIHILPQKGGLARPPGPTLRCSLRSQPSCWSGLLPRPPPGPCKAADLELIWTDRTSPLSPDWPTASAASLTKNPCLIFSQCSILPADLGPWLPSPSQGASPPAWERGTITYSWGACPAGARGERPGAPGFLRAPRRVCLPGVGTGIKTCPRTLSCPVCVSFTWQWNHGSHGERLRPADPLGAWRMAPPLATQQEPTTWDLGCGLGRGCSSPLPGSGGLGLGRPAE